jgi:hypothetical protein
MVEILKNIQPFPLWRLIFLQNQAVFIKTCADVVFFNVKPFPSVIHFVLVLQVRRAALRPGRRQTL